MPRTRALLAVAALLLPPLAGAQEFPPASEADRVTRGDPPRKFRVPIGVAAGYGAIGGSVVKGFAFTDALKPGANLRLDAGLGYEVAGFSVIYRRGFAKAGDRFCPPGATCDAKLESIDGALTISPGWEGKELPGMIALGGGVFTGEVSQSGVTQRVTGWEMLFSLCIGGRLGRAGSPWMLGGYLDFRLMNPSSVETPAGKATIKFEDAGTPIALEVGVRAAFD